MESPGPPPYTLEQINAITSPEEQLRARVELKSYIARLKKAKEERLANETYQPDCYPCDTAPNSDFRSTYGDAGGGTSGRGGAVYRGSSRGRSAYGGRGYASYHPYQRQHPHVPPTFKNKSVTFNKGDATAESSDPAGTASPSRPSANNPLPQVNGQPQTASVALCPALTSTGVCTRHGCRYIHDPNKQALCKRWLYKNDCPKGDYCSLSHTATSHNAPTCLHFQEGRCNNDNCRFAHVRINPAALNCLAFGRLGYCEKGHTCGELHAYECPTFANTGTCRYGDKCRLGHVRRASRMRQASRPSSVDKSSRSNSPEQELDVAEDVEEWVHPTSDSGVPPHQFTQQADFVPLAGDD